MKVVLVTGSTSSMTLVAWLMNQNILAGVVIQDVLNNHNTGLQQWLQNQRVDNVIAERLNLDTVVYRWLERIKPDMVIVFGFSFIIPQKFFDLAKFGFYNIHFSLLPAYKGPAPIFWQLRNGEKMSGISIHRMTNKPDSGEVLVQLPCQVPENDTLGLLHLRLTDLVIPALQQFLQLKLYTVERSPVKQVYELVASYQKRPEPADILISWQNMPANQIRSLVQATNPVYQGACTFFRESEVRILQASVLYKDSQAAFSGSKPGEIVPDLDGLNVKCCCGNIVQIEIVATIFGVMSGLLWKNAFVNKNQPGVKYFFS